MPNTNQYYDSNIYMQSANLIIKVAYMYYYRNMRQQEIAEQLDLSVPTVSRLLKRAKEQEIVHFSMEQEYLECLELEEALKKRFDLQEVIIAPLLNQGQGMEGEELKKIVALEGARYLQRTITDRDVLGIAYGETVWYVYNYLNPCQRRNMGFVTLHGTLNHEMNKLDGSWLVPRIAKVFGGKYYTINCKGIQKSREEVLNALKDDSICRVFEQFPNITISVSGVGMIYPEHQSVLVRGDYLSPETIKELEQAGACGDLLLRFFDKSGNECCTDMRSRVIGIPWENYKRIPNKVIVASDRRKWVAVLALLKGKLVDTLIIDQNLARSIYDALR